MNTRRFSEAIGEIDDRYIERALSYGAKKASFSPAKRRIPLPLVAAVTVILLMGSALAVALIYGGDLWIQKPSGDPVESVRAALENQAGKDYTIKIEVKSVEIDKAETSRTIERFLNGPIAEWNDWSEEYLTGHFAAVKAVYYAEYDHAQTTRSDGEVTMYFYLTRDVDSGEWTIVDNSGNVNWSESNPVSGSSGPAAGSVKEQIFSYLSELFNDAYALYYDGLHYEMNNYEETTDGDQVTAHFLWTMHFLGKGWDVASDEGVEQDVNWFLWVTAAVGEEGALDRETISVVADNSAAPGEEVYTPIEEYFPS